MNPPPPDPRALAFEPAVLPAHVGAIVDGQRVDEGELVPIVDPATAAVISHFIEADAALVDRAVRSATSTTASRANSRSSTCGR